MSAEIKGRVFSSSFDSGVKVILEDVTSVESIEVGRLAVIEGSEKHYLCIVDNMEYTVDRNLERLYSELEGTNLNKSFIDFIRRQASKHILNLIPVAEKPKSGDVESVSEVSSLPSIGSTLYQNQLEGVKGFYGEPNYVTSFPVGSVKTVFGDEYYIPIPLDILYNLSFGIFGKSGTGKTFLANLLIAYTALYNAYSRLDRDREDVISLLIFDTQGEYSSYLLDDKGQQVCEGACSKVNSLQNLGGFTIYALDPDIASQLNCISLKIPLKGISISDFFTLMGGISFPEGFKANIAQLKRIAENALENVHQRGYHFLSRDMWILPLLYSVEDVDWIARKLVSNGMIDLSGSNMEGLRNALIDLAEVFTSQISDRALISSLEAGRRRLVYLLNMPVSFREQDVNIYKDIANKLVNGESVVVNMGGRYGRNPFIYMAVANYIGEVLISTVDELVAQNNYDMKGKIAIYLEEAHRFLGKDVSIENPFGRIAREYRKYGLIVIPIDQRPRELDPNVVSMLWSKFIFNLEDDKDADVATTGLPMKKRFKELVMRLPRGSLVFYSGIIRYPVVLKAIEISKDRIPIPGHDDMKVYEYMEKVNSDIGGEITTGYEEP